MSKVICDVCGTTYPETTAQCPICGSAKASAEQTAAGGGHSDYTYVKGGRFSQQNVKKRNAGRSAAVATAAAPERRSASARPAQERPERAERQEQYDRPAPQRRPERRPSKKENNQSNAALIVIVVVLLIAIGVMITLLAVRYLGGGSGGENPSGSTSGTENSSTSATEDTGGANQPGGIPCQSLQVSTPNLEFLKAGDVWTLVVRCTPEDTTEKVTFSVADPSVATVDEMGVITAVNPGVTAVTVTCGSATATVNVKCSFGTVSTDPTDDPVPPVEQFTFSFRTKYTDDTTGYWDTTLKVGDEWKAYSNNSSIDPSLMTWSSDDTSICTVSEDGIVTVHSAGKTLIHAEYGGQTFTCIIRATN